MAGLAWARAVVVAVKEPEELLEVHPAAAQSAALRQQDTRGTARQPWELCAPASGIAGGPESVPGTLHVVYEELVEELKRHAALRLARAPRKICEGYLYAV